MTEERLESELDPVQEKAIENLVSEFGKIFLEGAVESGIIAYVHETGEQKMFDYMDKLDALIREHWGQAEVTPLSLAMYFLGAEKLSTALAYTLVQNGITSLDELDRKFAEGEISDE